MDIRTVLKFRQLGIIMMGWLAFAACMSVYDYLVIHSMNVIGPSANYNFVSALLANCFSAMLGCAIGGSFLVFIINERYNDKPFVYTILVTTAVYAGVIVIIVTSMTIGVIMKNGGSLSETNESAGLVIRFLTDETRLKNIVTWYVVVAATQMVLQLSKRFGEGNLGRILKGEYNVAREEKKIFMFLDLDNSTGLAENLGDDRYHSMLRDFFADITDAIVNNKGRIYQYVGDEVVVQWDFHCDAPNDNCIKAFFDIKQKMSEQKEKYMRRYGIAPSFKAGIHYGRVIAGEVGTVKREMTYSGDVLNTTSRITSMCSKLNTDLLVSGDLAAILGTSRYSMYSYGAFPLRGKGKEVILQSFLPVVGHHPASEMRLAWLTSPNFLSELST